MGKAFKQEALYIVELDELEWYSQDGEQQAKLSSGYVDRAKALGCVMLSIFVIPDPLFSMCGQNKKHRVFEKRIEVSNAPYKVEILLTADIALETWDKLAELDRKRLVRECRDALNDKAVTADIQGRYQITVGSTCVERGRV